MASDPNPEVAALDPDVDSKIQCVLEYVLLGFSATLFFAAPFVYLYIVIELPLWITLIVSFVFAALAIIAQFVSIRFRAILVCFVVSLFESHGQPVVLLQLCWIAIEKPLYGGIGALLSTANLNGNLIPGASNINEAGVALLFYNSVASIFRVVVHILVAVPYVVLVLYSCFEVRKLRRQSKTGDEDIVVSNSKCQNLGTYLSSYGSGAIASLLLFSLAFEKFSFRVKEAVVGSYPPDVESSSYWCYSIIVIGMVFVACQIWRSEVYDFKKGLVVRVLAGKTQILNRLSKGNVDAEGKVQAEVVIKTPRSQKKVKSAKDSSRQKGSKQVDSTKESIVLKPAKGTERLNRATNARLSISDDEASTISDYSSNERVSPLPPIVQHRRSARRQKSLPSLPPLSKSISRESSEYMYSVVDESRHRYRPAMSVPVPIILPMTHLAAPMTQLAAPCSMVPDYPQVSNIGQVTQADIFAAWNQRQLAQLPPATCDYMYRSQNSTYL